MIGYQPLDVFKISGGTVSWHSWKQSCVALLSSEAEYIAVTSAAQEAIWLRLLFSELEDNQSAICLSKKSPVHGQSEHVAIKYHFIRNQVKKGVIEVQYCHTGDMIADVFTKGLIK